MNPPAVTQALATARRTRRAWPLVALLAACADASPEGTARLSVYAASSLTEAFTEMERAFEAANPDVDVATTFAGSQVLRLQIEQGAPADVFASANLEHMRALADEGLVAHVRTLAHNELAVIVPLDDPAGIAEFADLPSAERIVLGVPHVPVGRYTREALGRAGARLGASFGARVLDRVVSLESNVRLLRSKVELGEADAAIVYRTDAVASDRVRMVPIPDDANVRAEYPMGLVLGGAAPELAGRWIDFVLSPEGRAILGGHGFLVD